MKRFVFVAAIAASVAPLVAQQTVDAPRSLTAVDYARAEKFLAASTTPLVYHAAGQPTWLADERFWYRVTTEKGNEAILVDAAAATRSPCTLPECARPGGGRGPGRLARDRLRTAKRHPVPGRQARRLHPRLESLGPRRRYRQGDAAHDRRRQGLRLRHRQRRLDAAATGRSCCGRRIPRRSPRSSRISATSARCIWSTRGRPSETRRRGSIRCPATSVVAMMQRVIIDVDGRQGRPLQDAAGSASLDALRRRRLPRRTGRTCSGARDGSSSRSSRPRAITSRTAARRRRRDRRGS